MIRAPRPALLHELPETGEIALCDLGSERLVVLNPIGAAVWQLLDGQRSIEEIVALVSETLGVDAPRVRADVEAFIESLDAQGLLEPLALA